jgi:ABC-type transport system involved in cytochrome c biogenesis permease subunit
MDINELPVLWLALLAQVAAGVLAIFAQVLGRRPERTILVLLAMGVLLLTVAIAGRWMRLGYGPFASMFEILLSNLWSLSLIFTLAYWRLPPIRPIACVVMPVLFVLMGWLLVADPVGNRLPPTFDTVWLYVHIGFAKVFVGTLLIALGIAGVVLYRRGFGAHRFANMPNDASLDELGFRFVAISLIFDTLMLVSGAIWAQDAWGRYWGWDPLETASFVTWVLLAIALHLRLTFKIRPVTGAWLIVTIFVVSFLTFFGVPFITQAPHQATFS